jgi:hypothetical protein
MAIVDAFSDGETALRAYLRLHRDAPLRELYVVHSDHEELEITERSLLGLRTAEMPEPPDALHRLRDVSGTEYASPSVWTSLP